MASARECGSGAGLDSNMVERTPWRARPRARAKPTGPPPTISTGDSFMTEETYAKVLLLLGGYQRRAIRQVKWAVGWDRSRNFLDSYVADRPGPGERIVNDLIWQYKNSQFVGAS